MTLVEVLVTIAIVVVAFGGFAALFQASLRYIYSARAREAAVSLATERLEEMRAMAYDDIGTSGGIPAGTIPQNETVTQDGLDFNRRTFVQYVDDPADGLGAADTNSISSDYKRAKVEVSWTGQNGISSSVALISNFTPVGVETGTGQGTLAIQAIDAGAAPIANATVHIVNSSASPAIDVTTYTDTSGQVLFPGTPAASAFEITVSKSGYSTAQTYSVSASNPNPNPGDLTVSVGLTTTASFAIDRLASLLLHTWTPIQPATFTDALNDASGIGQQTQTAVSGGALSLDTDPSAGGNYYASGSAYSTAIAPSYLANWSSLDWNSTTPANTGILVHLYTGSPGSYTLVPDAVLSGNSAGFSAGPVDISGISTSTYPSLVIGADLTTADPAATPSILDWSLDYKKGPVPLPNITLTLQGAKTIGTNGSGASIYKFSQPITTDASAQYSNSTLEWDSYTLTADPANGYDISSSCPLQPLSVAPASSGTADIYLLSHTSDSLKVSVSDASTGAALVGATVALSRTGYSGSATTDSCGQAFFPGLASASDYAATVSATGYTAKNLTGISVSGQSSLPVSL